MNKASVHVTQPGNTGELGDLLRLTGSGDNYIPIIYALNANIKPDIVRYSSRTKIVYRRQSDVFARLPNDLYTGDPAQSAINWLTKIKDPSDQNRTLIQNWQLNPADFYDPLNEPVIELPPDPTDAQIQDAIRKAQWLNTWMITALDIASSYGLKLALFSFPTGSPPMEVWSYLFPALRKGKILGAVLSLHEYSVYGSLQNPKPGNVLRYRDVWSILPIDCQIPIVISECGAGNGYDTGLSGQAWVNDLMWYNAQVCQDDYAVGFCAFQLGGIESNMTSTIPAYTTAIVDFQCPSQPPVLQESANNSTLPPEEKIIDSNLRVWTFGEVVPMGRVILRNGIQYAGGQGNLLLYWQKKIYVKNINNEWYVAANDTWQREPGDPRYSIEKPKFKLVSPIRNIPFRVTDVFDSPRGYANGKHEGIDLDCYDERIGHAVAIYAAREGVVEYIRTSGYSNSGYGKYVIVHHTHLGQTYKTWYCHLSEVTCSVGQSVTTASQIGVGGNTGTAAIHLHLNLQRIGSGLSGYYIPDVVDPLPYIVTLTTPPTTNIGTVGIRSVHGRADGGQLRSVDIQAAKTSPLINGYKLYKNSREDYTTLRANGFDLSRVVVRLDHIKDRRVNADFYINAQNTGIWDLPLKEAIAEGVVWFEMFNEVNLGVEGYGLAWTSPTDFCNLFKQVLSLARAKYPSAQFLSPSVSPQPDTETWWGAFSTNGVFAACDGYAAHAYWDSLNGNYPMDSVSGGRHYRGLFPYLTGTKKVHVTEASNNASLDSDTNKGKQYAQYLKTIEIDKVARVDFFCVSSSDVGDGALFNSRRETWVRGDTISEIPRNII